MQLIDFTGKRFGKLLVLERDTAKINGTYWRCQCDCGNIISCRRDVLIKKQYPKRSCGCDLKRKASQTHTIDETGNRYGKLVVLEQVLNDIANPNGALWKCQCDCGNICYIPGTRLRNGNTKSCGCLRYDSHNGIDETGHVYGDLTVLGRSLYKDNTHIFWHCQCTCGNTCEVNGTQLRQGTALNCGCQRSLGETKIQQLLTQYHIKFKREYTFADLLGIGGGRLRFDFAILDDNNQVLQLIEFDGIQHFEANCFGNDETAFTILQQHDQMKDEYCQTHHIPLVRLSYLQLKTLSIQDLQIQC